MMVRWFWPTRAESRAPTGRVSSRDVRAGMRVAALMALSNTATSAVARAGRSGGRTWRNFIQSRQTPRAMPVVASDATIAL